MNLLKSLILSGIVLLGSCNLKQKTDLSLDQMKKTTFDLINQDFDEMKQGETCICYSDAHFLQYVETVEKAVEEIMAEIDDQAAKNFSLDDASLQKDIAAVLEKTKAVKRANEYRKGEKNIYFEITSISFLEALDIFRKKLEDSLF